MKHKYVLCGGLAFSEDRDLRKLSRLAEKGWILEDLSGLFYKLRKGSPQKLVYAIDYRADYDEEYFDIFSNSGWTHVTTCDDTIHFFSAPCGTKPIYSDKTEQADKYTAIMKQMTVNSIIFLPIVLLAVYFFFKSSGWKSGLAFAFYGITITIFVFNFLPLLGYIHKKRKLKDQAN